MYIIVVTSWLCGLVGNMKLIWILGFCTERNPFTTYMLNLALAGFGTVLSELAGGIITDLVLFNDAFHGVSDLISSLPDVLLFFTYCASLYLLTAVSLEMVLSVLFPVWYQCQRPGKSSAVVSFLLWSLSGLLSGILLLCYLQGQYGGTIENILCIANFLICVPLMIASSLTVMATLCCKSQRRQLPKLYVTVLIPILIFIVLGIPLNVLYPFFFKADDFPMETVELSYLLASFISSIHPFIYSLVGRKRKRQPRESLKVTLHRLVKEEADAREKLGKDSRRRRVRQR